MLDLQPGVHLQEVEVAVLVDDELDGARRLVIHGLGERHRLRAHVFAGGLVEERRRRFLDHFLVTPLQRAFALVEVHSVAMAVGHDLDLDVPRFLDEFLDEDLVVTETRAGLVRGTFETVAAFSVVAGDAHALAAAAGGRLEHDRVADVLGHLDGVIGVLHRAGEARDRVDAGLVGQLLGRDLVAHRLDRAGVRADEDDIRRVQGRPELGVLGQETVARVHGLGARVQAGLDDLVLQQIALRRGRRADMHGLIGHLHMQRITIGVGVDGNGRDAHAARAFYDPAGNLTAIRNQDFLEHRRPP